MRESKFRGFNRKNGVWLYGFYLQNRGAHFVCPDEFADGKSWDDYEIDPETRGEYTGLKDKNGREIYEGDILSDICYGKSWVVTFECGSFDVRHVQEKFSRPLDEISSDSEVIGNIHDNPELLKEE